MIKFGRLFFLCVFVPCILAVLIPENLFAAEAPDEAAKLSSIVNKMIDAYGGKEAIERITSFHATGKTEAFMLQDNGTYELYFKRGRKLRIETRYGSAWELRILNGARGYRASSSLPLEEAFGPRYVAMVYQYKHLDILHDLVRGTYRIRLAGGSKTEVGDVEVLELSDKDGAVMEVSVDARNFLIARVTGSFMEGNKSISLSAELSDYKKVGGSVFPFKITNYAAGMKIAQTVIEKYIINPEIPDSIFEPALIQSF